MVKAYVRIVAPASLLFVESDKVCKCDHAAQRWAFLDSFSIARHDLSVACHSVIYGAVQQRPQLCVN